MILISFLFFSPLSLFADNKSIIENDGIIIPIEQLAPKVRFIRLTNDGRVKYELRDGGLNLKVIEDEDEISENSPEIIQALEKSFEQKGKWAKLESIK